MRYKVVSFLALSLLVTTIIAVIFSGSPTTQAASIRHPSHHAKHQSRRPSSSFWYTPTPTTTVAGATATATFPTATATVAFATPTATVPTLPTAAPTQIGLTPTSTIVIGPSNAGIDMAIKVAHAGQGCVPYNHTVTFYIMARSLPSSGKISSGKIEVTFAQPVHLANIHISGNDWSYHKNGSNFSVTYTGSYPIYRGTELPTITVTGTNTDTNGGHTILAVTLHDANDVYHANNFSSTQTSLCNTESSGSSGGSGSSSGGGSGSGSQPGYPGMPGTGSDPNA